MIRRSLGASGGAARSTMPRWWVLLVGMALLAAACDAGAAEGIRRIDDQQVDGSSEDAKPGRGRGREGGRAGENGNRPSDTQPTDTEGDAGGGESSDTTQATSGDGSDAPSVPTLPDDSEPSDGDGAGETPGIPTVPEDGTDSTSQGDGDTSTTPSTTAATTTTTTNGSADSSAPSTATDPGTAPAPQGDATRVITNADRSSLARGFTVPAGEVWSFDSQADVTIEVSGNVQVMGVLRMRPGSSDVEHTLRFVDVNEGAMVGGGMSVLASDVGLWVTGDGQLDLQGAPRTGWTSLAGGAQAGASEIVLVEAPTGWRAGDELAIAPTASPDSQGFSTQFDEVTIKSISGSRVTLNSPLRYAHPEVNGQWTAEVMNLTRNVRVEGVGNDGPRPAGRAHVLIMSSRPQSIRHVQLQHLGARRISGSSTEGVTGRYSLHFHHNRDGSRGSLVEGVVVRNSGNSAYVPHASYGITFRDNIAYNGWEHAFWWDPPENRSGEHTHDSNDILIDRNIVALLQDDPGFRGYRLSGYTLATGSNLTIRDSVAVGVQGNVDASGFRWPEAINDLAVWTFERNRAHNNRADGIFVWQNSSDLHLIEDFAAYHNGAVGIDHGAYVNRYQYRDLDLFGNGLADISQDAGSMPGVFRGDGYGLTFENVRAGGVLLVEHTNLSPSMPTLHRNCRYETVVIDNDGSPRSPSTARFRRVWARRGGLPFRISRARHHHSGTGRIHGVPARLARDSDEHRHLLSVDAHGTSYGMSTEPGCG